MLLKSLSSSALIRYIFSFKNHCWAQALAMRLCACLTYIKFQHFCQTFLLSFLTYMDLFLFTKATLSPQSLVTKTCSQECFKISLLHNLVEALKNTKCLFQKHEQGKTCLLNNQYVLHGRVDCLTCNYCKLTKVCMRGKIGSQAS